MKDSRLDDEPEQVLEGLESSVEPLGQLRLFGVAHVVVQDLGELPERAGETQRVSVDEQDEPGRKVGNTNSHVGQSGAEVLCDVGFQNRVEVLEFNVSDERDYKNLLTNKNRKHTEEYSKTYYSVYSQSALLIQYAASCFENLKIKHNKRTKNTTLDNAAL